MTLLQLYLGTLSAIKVSAVKDAAASLDLQLVLHAVDVPSGVPPQPIGRNQTAEGARNRAVAALANAPQGKSDDTCGNTLVLGLGIENGMWPSSNEVEEFAQDESDEGGWVDGAAVVCVWRDEGNDGTIREATAWSDVLPIPPLSSRPFRRAPDGCWSELKDPQVVLTNNARDRRSFLVPSIAEVLQLAGFRRNSEQ